MENTLLIIDDNRDILEIIQELLSEQFDKVVTAMTVEAAFEQLTKNQFTFIILDIHLRDRNGAEVVKFLIDHPENKNNGCPIFILSGIINEKFIEKNKQRFAGIIIKPFESNELIATVKNILSGDAEAELSYEDIPVPECALPFPVPQLQQKVSSIMDNVKKNSKLKMLFSSLKVNRNGDDFIMTHIGMLINISTGIAMKMEWNTDKTLEKFVYAAYLHDLALADRPDLARIKGTAIELELMKEKMDLNDYKLVFEHANIAAKMIDSIVEIPQDVGLIVKQHHELPKENGFPSRISSSKITPLSTIFIVAHDMVHYILGNPKWTVKEYVAGTKNKFKGPHFAKVISALSELS